MISLPDTFRTIGRNAVADASEVVEWPKTYKNSDTGRVYKPHHDLENRWVYDDTPRYLLCRGGEGSGKSVGLIIKTLERLRRGMSGIMVSPNLPHFRRSLWPEFQRWVPPGVVVKENQRMLSKTWVPRQAFRIVFKNELGGQSVLDCAGAENPIMLEGPNLSFAALDEIRGMPNAEIVKVLGGRIRIPGPNGEKPQLFCASTPKMHWMFEYFGPPKPDDEPFIQDFKANSFVIQLSTEDNVVNLDEDFVEARGAVLNEREKDVRLRGEWVDEEDDTRFLEDIAQWDRLRRDLPGVRRKDDRHADYSDKLVVGLDASVSRDHFAMVAVSRSPFNREETAVRYVRLWIPPKNGKLDFTRIKGEIVEFLKTYNVVTIVYDEYQLHQMATELLQAGLVWTQPFGQNKPRSLADQGLYDAILQGTIVHDGNVSLRTHINNADKKEDHQNNKRRLAKRTTKLKIDLAVALGMARYECERLNL